MPRFIECCCDGLEAAREAWKGGADRIELCRDLPTGGLTPEHDVIARAVLEAGGKPVNVLIRPREGDFVYSAEEIALMVSDIRYCLRSGVNAVVTGALNPDGSVDMEAMKTLMAAARPEGEAGLEVTFHRAFDECNDVKAALEQIISLGCDRLLTSGHEPDAYLGRGTIAGLVEQAGERMVIMPGCGINPTNIACIESVTGAREFHSSSKGACGRTDSQTVEKLKNII